MEIYHQVISKEILHSKKRGGKARAREKVEREIDFFVGTKVLRHCVHEVVALDSALSAPHIPVVALIRNLRGKASFRKRKSFKKLPVIPVMGPHLDPPMPTGG